MSQLNDCKYRSILTLNADPSSHNESPKKNLVLFVSQSNFLQDFFVLFLRLTVTQMPYMHWDTHRKTKIRSNITKAKEVSIIQNEVFLGYLDEERWFLTIKSNSII